MSLPKIGFSIGDINGVGLEVIIKSLLKPHYHKYFIPIIYASPKVVAFHRNIVTKEDLPLHNISAEDQAKHGKINILTCWEENVEITIGAVNEIGGQYAMKSLHAAVKALQSAKIDAIVTAPIHKKAMDMAGFGFPGHTEFFAHHFKAPNQLMLMVNDTLRVGVVTGHIALKDVAKSISKDLVIKKAQAFLHTLKMDFGKEKPLLAVLGLNPHAGDQGLFGDEEEKIIKPAIAELKRQGHLVIGPFPADGFFGSGQFEKYDGVLAMYHDQGLIPFKTLAFGGGINFTAGLPIIRTSPDHGTAHDIAGKNTASEMSIRHATSLALDIYRSRKEYNDLEANKLVRGRVVNDGEDEIILDDDN